MEWLKSPMFTVVIFAFQCQETIPTRSFACEMPVRGSFSQFKFSRRLLCPRLHHTKISRYTVYAIQIDYYYDVTYQPQGMILMHVIKLIILHAGMCLLSSPQKLIMIFQ